MGQRVVKQGCGNDICDMCLKRKGYVKKVPMYKEDGSMIKMCNTCSGLASKLAKAISRIIGDS